MIVVIQKSGRSFRGAAAYYLHDKAADRDLARHLKPRTDERVWFTDTRNCVSFDPVKATDEMWATAEMAQQLKRAAGMPLTGRKMRDPVKTLSLSWHPDEKLTPEQMIEAADSYLKFMGWHEHQAILIGHRDTQHPHIHIALNRVHPETGMTLDDGNEKRRTQQWALEYEKEHGRIFCDGRLDPTNDNARDLPPNVIDMSRPREKEFLSAEAKKEAEDHLEHDLLKAQQRAEREAFFKQGRKIFRDLRDAVYREVRDDYKEDWHAYYQEKAEAERLARKLAAAETARAFGEGRAGHWDTAWRVFDGRHQRLDEVHEVFSQRARDLRAAQVAETRETQDQAIKVLREQRDAEYVELKRRQQEERDQMRAAHAAGERAADLLRPTYAAFNANDNAEPAFPSAPTPANRNAPPGTPHARTADEAPRSVDTILGFEPGPQKQPEPETSRDGGGSKPPDEPRQPQADIPDAPEVKKQGADLAAGTIGSVASYLADQMAELFAPTPPAERAARAREEARQREAARAAEDRKDNPFACHAEAAIKRAEAEAEKKRERDYWDDRDRQRER